MEVSGSAKAKRLEAVVGRTGTGWWSGRCRIVRVNRRIMIRGPMKTRADAWPAAGRPLARGLGAAVSRMFAVGRWSKEWV